MCSCKFAERLIKDSHNCK